MSVISASQVKELREISGAGMMDCKKALEENAGNIQDAVDWLRKKGLAKAAKKAGRVAAEGLVALATSGNQGVIIELNSETDFVARNEQFQQLAEAIAQTALHTDASIDAIKAAPCMGKNVDAAIVDAIAGIGENMNLRRAVQVRVEQGLVSSYVHSAVKAGLGKIGVLVALQTNQPTNDAVAALGKQLAMHIAAARPEALTRDGVDASLLERERAVFKDQAIASGKTEEIAEKMVEGRIRKFYEEVVLLEQNFVIDGKTKISDVVAHVAKDAGCTIAIADYAILVLGEGVEKEETDFAAEVAAAVAGA
ncbi:MAG: elongation factor Ts [Alphaproteobacteria bacterium]|nr:MAG: elongation factor Ts [Alphaproteobacteria bacterium]TAF39071.1 MAG: elongation factor Ts [Alphaproteobacteria bacterium]TAF75174.1 MAG: elongation factor Ts [Alphaproteobacteria bacterium]